jgi:anthranilate synthase component I
VSDPFSDFVARAERSDVAGYFERAPGHSSPTGTAVWFDRGELLPAIRTERDLDVTRRRVSRHLAGRPRRAALGYLGFEAYDLFEPAVRTAMASGPFPRGEFLLASEVHRVALPRRRPTRPVGSVPALGRPRTDSMSPVAYRTSVQHLRRAIRTGEAFQVVLAHRREWNRPDDLLRRAQLLRTVERYAYFYYLRCADREVVGASPESVVEVERGVARVNPIAGTLPDKPHGSRLPLLEDSKELCEHRMLVDLARNDLGRVARPGSVRVLWQERRMRYAHLEHLVSRVEARTRSGAGPWEVLGAAFPAGTVTGAPKIRATEWIRREEESWRGPYGGTVGLFLPGGRAEFALTIRSAFACRDRLYTAAGAGIVHASRPAQEYHETLAKLAVVEATLAGGVG